MGTIETRVCRRCGVEQPIFNFYVREHGRRDRVCKHCKRTERQKKKKKNPDLHTQTICWLCRKAAGHCCWSAADHTKDGRPIRFEPVPGWTAIRTPGMKGRKSESYLVISCPEFEPDERSDVGE